MSTSAEPVEIESRQSQIAVKRGELAGYSVLARPRFRGEIWKNTEKVPMGRGYANEGKPFDIETACYLKPIFRAIRNPDIPVIAVLAAVQMLKTFACIEESAAYFIEHDPGDMTIYIGGDDSARDQARARIIPRFRSIPGVSSQILAAEQNDRFDINTQEFYLPAMILRIWGLSENTTARMTLRRVLGSDLYLSKNSGLWLQAIARTTQHQQRKIIGESQGGEEGDDMDKFWKTTNMGYLHVTCPLCGTFQPFEFHRERLDEFIATPPLTIPSLDHKDWINHHTPILKSPERCHTGFQRGDDDLIKRADGSYNEAEILKQTYYECFHCGGAWHDNPETRKKLDETSDYVPSNPNALPGYLGFSWPSWAGQRLRWGGEYVMLGYLRAKQTQEKLGNVEELKQWYQKRAGRPWTTDLSAKSPERIGATIYDIDPKLKYPGELVRISGIDFQFNGTHMPYQTWAIGDGRRPRLLHWEWIKPSVAGPTDEQARQFCKARVRALNKEWGIEQQNCMIDAAHRPDLVREWAAEDAVFAKIRIGARITNKWVSYGLLMGDDKVSYKWAHPGRAATLERFKQFEWVNVEIVKDGRRQRIPIHHRLWSNPSIKEIAERWRDGDGAPKIEVHENFLKEKGKDGFWSQMISERKLPWKGRPGKLRYDNEGRPNHAWDGFCMVLVRMDELGYLNSFGPPSEDAD
jgi:hypothetical protein